MKADAKKYEIRSVRRPRKQTLLSATVAVRNEEGETGYCYIGFAFALVQDVGKALPRGVSAHDPAYIEVVHYAPSDVWLVKARYAHSPEEEVLLWKSAHKPAWLRFYKQRGTHGTHPPTP